MHRRRKFWRYFNSRLCTCGLLWPCIERDLAAARTRWRVSQRTAWNAKTTEFSAYRPEHPGRTDQSARAAAHRKRRSRT